MVPSYQLFDIIHPAINLAKQYAARRSEILITEKTAGQFVSEADEAIETQIRAAIFEKHGHCSVIGEEQGGSLADGMSGWAIDPIDGTTNFLRGLPMWGISIGVLKNGVSVAGAIALPDLDLVLVSDAGKPLEVNGQTWVRPSSPIGGNLIALGENDGETGEQTDARACQLRAQGYTVVRYRSAVFSLACAALGRLDGYVEHGCGLWDVAAASIICRDAGLVVDVMSLGAQRYAIEAKYPL
jgi:myo-inositol-1(or 4)-monophosphatase